MAIRVPTKSAAEMMAELRKHNAVQQWEPEKELAKIGKSKRPALTPAGGKVSRPPIDELKKKIDAIPAAPAKRKKPVHKIEEGLNEALAVARGETEPHKIHTRSGRGRPKSGKTETAVLSVRLDKDLVDMIKAYPNWQKVVETILSGQFSPER